MKYYSIGEFSKETVKTTHIVTVFSCRLQGERGNKVKSMIKELLENDTREES